MSIATTTRAPSNTPSEDAAPKERQASGKQHHDAPH